MEANCEAHQDPRHLRPVQGRWCLSIVWLLVEWSTAGNVPFTTSSFSSLGGILVVSSQSKNVVRLFHCEFAIKRVFKHNFSLFECCPSSSLPFRTLLGATLVMLQKKRHEQIVFLLSNNDSWPVSKMCHKVVRSSVLSRSTLRQNEDHVSVGTPLEEDSTWHRPTKHVSCGDLCPVFRRHDESPTIMTYADQPQERDPKLPKTRSLHF